MFIQRLLGKGLQVPSCIFSGANQFLNGGPWVSYFIPSSSLNLLWNFCLFLTCSACFLPGDMLEIKQGGRRSLKVNWWCGGTTWDQLHYGICVICGALKLEQLWHHSVIGIFQLHFNLMGPWWYRWSITDRNVAMWHKTLLAVVSSKFLNLPMPQLAHFVIKFNITYII